ncbi:MAG: Bug family tripartite tricarboxylate transporter substrate binding protein [Burkholderiales bacterium]
MKIYFSFYALWAIAGVINPEIGFAQSYPAKPVRLMVPFPGGASGVDFTARLFAPKLGEILGQPVFIENRGGANGMIGSDNIAKSAPDGYSLLYTTPSTHVTATFISKNVPYDPIKDFTPISAAVEPVSGIVVWPKLPIANVKEMVAYAKANRGKLTFTSSGIGSVFHLTGELLNSAAGIDLVHVPYKGTQQALTDNMSGDVSMTLAAISGTLAFARSGKLRMIAILEGRRFAGLPDMPTVGESVPGFEKPSSWFGFFGPANLPAPIVTRLHGDIVKMLNAPEIRGKLEESGVAVIGNSPVEFATLIKRGYEVYGKAFALSGIKPE